MPVCETCEGEDFDEIDGFFYCTVCQSQSQVIRVEEIDEEGIPPVVIRELKQPAAKRIKSKKDLGRPWHTYEAFTLIIKEQVKSLIDHGASQDLKTVVFQLWRKYLSMTGIAFPEDLQKQREIFDGFQREREVYPGTSKDPRIYPRRFRHTYFSRYGHSVKKTEEMNMKTELADALIDEEFYEGDNPLDDTNDSITLEADNEDDDSILRKDAKVKFDTVRKRIQWMSMNKTLCFCFIGLLKMKCIVTASDIVRWVKQDRLPYLRVTKHLPENFKFSVSDNSTFRAKLPTVEEIYTVSHRLSKFLEPPTGVQLVSTPILISRFILHLNLPADLHGFVQRLYRKQFGSPDKKIPEGYTESNNEITAMACIITTLQLFLGLNDCMEWEMSRCTRAIMKLPNFRFKLFCWDEWVSYICTHGLAGIYFSTFLKKIDPREVRDVEKYVAEAMSVKTQVRRKTNGPGETKGRIVQAETAESIKRPLSMLLEELKKRDNIMKNQQHKDMGATSRYCEEDPMGYVLGEYDDVEENMDTDDKVSYRHHSTKYITQPLTFVKELENQGLLEAAIVSSCQESSDDEDQAANISDENGEIDKFDNIMQEKQILKKKRKLQELQKHFRVNDKFPDVKFNLESFMKLTNQLIDIQQVFPLVDVSTNQSNSLQWLVQTCAKIILCSKDDLNLELRKFQCLVFGNNKVDRRDLLKDIVNT